MRDLAFRCVPNGKKDRGTIQVINGKHKTDLFDQSKKTFDSLITSFSCLYYDQDHDLYITPGSWEERDHGRS